MVSWAMPSAAEALRSDKPQAMSSQTSLPISGLNLGGRPRRFGRSSVRRARDDAGAGRFAGCCCFLATSGIGSALVFDVGARLGGLAVCFMQAIPHHQRLGYAKE